MRATILCWLSLVVACGVDEAKKSTSTSAPTYVRSCLYTDKGDPAPDQCLEMSAVGPDMTALVDERLATVCASERATRLDGACPVEGIKGGCRTLSAAGGQSLTSTTWFYRSTVESIKKTCEAIKSDGQPSTFVEGPSAATGTGTNDGAGTGTSTAAGTGTGTGAGTENLQQSPGATGVWTAIAAPPGFPAAAELDVVAHGTKLIAWGGRLKDAVAPIANVAVYDTGTGAWTELTPPASVEPRSGGTLVAVTSGVVLLNGDQSRQVTFLDVAAGQFRNAPGGIDRSFRFKTATRGDEVYIVHDKGVARFDAAANTLETLAVPTTIAAKNVMDGVAVNARYLVASGYRDGRARTGFVYDLDAKTTVTLTEANFPPYPSLGNTSGNEFYYALADGTFLTLGFSRIFDWQGRKGRDALFDPASLGFTVVTAVGGNGLYEPGEPGTVLSVDAKRLRVFESFILDCRILDYDVAKQEWSSRADIVRIPVAGQLECPRALAVGDRIFGVLGSKIYELTGVDLK